MRDIIKTMTMPHGDNNVGNMYNNHNVVIDRR